MTGKVVVVTGASMGIGEAIVGRFLREGASVVLASRDPAERPAAHGGARQRALRASLKEAYSTEPWPWPAT